MPEDEHVGERVAPVGDHVVLHVPLRRRPVVERVRVDDVSHRRSRRDGLQVRPRSTPEPVEESLDEVTEAVRRREPTAGPLARQRPSGRLDRLVHANTPAPVVLIDTGRQFRIDRVRRRPRTKPVPLSVSPEPGCERRFVHRKNGRPTVRTRVRAVALAEPIEQRSQLLRIKIPDLAALQRRVTRQIGEQRFAGVPRRRPA